MTATARADDDPFPPLRGLARHGVLKDHKAFTIWLLVMFAAVAGTLILGGVTRLTDSGLSITEWRPISGILPPLDAHQWQAEFAKYQQIPQFRIVYPTMDLAEFKHIFFWEWAHRNLARSIGLFFVLPIWVFAVRGAISARLGLELFYLFALGALQGGIGWWMVESGLSGEAAHVAPWRLAVHLFVPVVILLWIFGLLTSAMFDRPDRPFLWAPRRRFFAMLLFGLIFLQMFLGALTAGNRAGRIYTDWPFMNGALFPRDYDRLQPFARNLVENPAAVQFDHRILAYVIFALAWLVYFQRPRVPAPARWAAPAPFTDPHLITAIAVSAQAVLGVATLMSAAALPLALAHQLMGVVTLLSAAYLMVRTFPFPFRRRPEPASAS